MGALGKLHLSPWLIALLVAGWLLEDGVPTGMLIGLGCVLLHETGHAVCARLCGCEVERMELTPFGGAARVVGMEQLSAAKRAGIALAGPAVNLLLGMLCGCGAYLQPAWTPALAEGLGSNAALLFFNLLPAYPMDGGHMLCALLEGRHGMERAQRLTAALGIALGSVLAILGAVTYFMLGKFNITLVLCGGYLVMAAHKAYRNMPMLCMTQILGREKALRRQEMLPVRMLAVRNGTSDARIMAKLRPGALYRIVYVDEQLRVTREAWESELWQKIR